MFKKMLKNQYNLIKLVNFQRQYLQYYLLFFIWSNHILVTSSNITSVYENNSENVKDTNEIEFASLDGATQPMTSFTELKGGEITNELKLHYSKSPYVVRDDIIVTKDAKFLIEPGVKIAFASTVRIIVRGILYAAGTSTSRITLTSLATQSFNLTQTDLPDLEERGIRLVNGPTPLEGRLQIYHKGSWRSVCTNSRNWTITDYHIACRQLGFKGGRFWNWVERKPGYEPRLLYEQPNCKGSESSIFNCNWHTRQLGSGVCDYHNDIGIQCLPLHTSNIQNWGGIYFENAPSSKSLGRDNTIYSALSHSLLKYVDITKAGVGPGLTAKASVEVIGIPPVMQHIVVSHSAYTAINITKPHAGFVFQNVTVRQNKGIGIFVNSSQGDVQLEGCNVINNEGDGVKYIGHDLRSNERYDRATIYDFCTLPTTSGQTYPITLSFNQKYYVGSAKKCSKYFFTRPDYLLTVNFEDIVLHKNETATIEIYDGSSENDRLLFSWKARNYTRPQSVTSTKEKLFIRIIADAREELSMFLRLESGKTRSYDLLISDSIIEDNIGRGVVIDNIRSKLHIHGSSVSGNGYVAGVHVTSGAGDVNITSSNISFNNGEGVNITYYGGNRNISRSTIGSNKGYGISVWLNDTTDINRMEYIPVNQTTVVEYSQIITNLEHAILHGNFCNPMWVNITGNYFNNSFKNDITILSCWCRTIYKEPVLSLQIGHNMFENSQRNPIYLSPALNMLTKIEYNHFTNGNHGSIYIRNDFIYQELNFLPVRIFILSNHFMRNHGIYVASLGLSPYSRRDLQYLLFSRNFIRENKIMEPFGPLIDGTEGNDGSGRLNPRSRVAAVVVVGSSNIDIYRNIFHNLDSTYEIGSQLSDQSQIINATYNWLGFTDEKKIYSRLFHRNDRYNLAKIEYIPYLLHNSNPSSSTVIAITTLVPRFFNAGSELIGGEIDGQEIIPSGTYVVSKDINIRPGGKLILQPGVTLKFEPSVGMMVAGKLEARGRRPDDIMFTLKRSTIITFDNETESHTENIDTDVININTESNIEKNEPPNVPVRLLGGSGSHEGRLQLYIDGRWGTVCDYGWTIQNAALVCHHLGYTLNPRDWRLLRYQMPNVGLSEDIIVSNVRCTEQDLDITKCRAEHLSRGEFENSCSHDNDVGIRCYEGAWAGVRFSMLAERTDLQYVTVEKAGLFDYATNSFKPAIQMDFARHNLENVRIVNNLDDGLGVIYSDTYGGKSVNNIKNSEFISNRGSGISFKQLDMRIQGSIVKNNFGSGISHNPVISAIDQKEIGGWFRMAGDFNTFELNYEPFLLPSSAGNIELGQWEHKYVRTEEILGEPKSSKVFVRCPPGYVLGIQLLNPIQNLSTENIIILDSQTENDRTDVWNVGRDLNVFPTTSSSYGVVIKYDSGLNGLGGTVLMFSTIQAPVQNIRNRVVRGPVPTLVIRSTKIQKNLRGISAFYYNRYIGDNGEYYLRKANESIKMSNSEISFNTKEAVLIKSPFWDVKSSNLSEITIHINNSIITQNGFGIRQVSKDLRSSNNLFHYVIQDTTIENNLNGGFQVSLPYVWQYNENFTHSIYFGNSTWQGNRNFIVEVRGHFSVLNITSNVFLNNFCAKALISLDGMEKRLKIDNNRIESNYAKYIIEFKADSLSEIIGVVPAVMEYNIIKGNKFGALNKHGYMKSSSFVNERLIQDQNIESSTVIRLDGIQNVKMYRNLISENNMTFNLVSGVRSARLNNYFYATENWWGSKDAKYIESKIFDFDNWNDHADAIFQPFLIEDSFDASISLISDKNEDININSWSGGRVYKDIILKKRQSPYHIISDITVMPGVTLTLQHGVQMEFEQNIGILVLGTLTAIGYKESPIVLRPFQNNNHETYKTMSKKRSLEDMERLMSFDFIRLCINSQNCTTDEQTSKNINEGFLEYFNHTTLQWVPICDSRFTERNAQVVCRELGFDPLNVFYSHDRRLEYHTNSLTRIWTWVQPLECRGDELRMEDCAERLNGQLYGHRHECHWDDVFVFVSCNGILEEQTYWGGIRFANADFEQNQYEHRLRDTQMHMKKKSKESHLEFVRIENAGILHNQKAAAIQSIFKNPLINSVYITNSAYHGINFVSPSGSINLNVINISKAFGSGITILSLTGEGRESDESSFTPLKNLDIPYKLFSMVDICDPQKELTVEERIIIYYKYDNNPVNCVKIFTALYRSKPIGFRLLQSNLFNHSKLYGRMDTIRLFDGDIYNVTSKYLGNIEADSKNQRSFFKTSGPTLSLQLIASGAPEHHGFIAEIVTVPISTIGQYRDVLHNITYSHISGAVKGAILYASAGEITPTLTITSNRIANNCLQLYGNFSTCNSALDFDVQNMNSLYFMNNLLIENQGGLKIRADSRGSATSLRGFLHHNLFYKNRNRPVLFIEGRQSSPYQEIELFRNYFAQNKAGYEDVIKLRQVVSNFSFNYVHSNFGGRIVDVSGFEKVRLPIYQTTANNGFYGNVATNWMGRATIVAGTAGQQYVDNIFENPDNDYEIITVNNTIFSYDFRNSTIELWRSRVDARYNYWSYNNTISVQSRIRDKNDDPLLLEVLAIPFQMNNQTILDGKCPPGWNLVHDTCFIYIGAPMAFNEAREFCRSENSSMPFIRTDTGVLWNYLQRQMRHLKYPEKVWIQDFNHIDRCTSFVYGAIEIEDCHKEIGFICEIDPKVAIDPLSWRADIFAISIISAFILAVILLIMIAFCWYAKSKHRHVQRLQRRNSIRQSLRSLNSIEPQGSLRRRNFSTSSGTLTKGIGQDYKKMIGNGSLDSMDKSVLSSNGSFEAFENHIGQNEYIQHNSIQGTTSIPSEPQKVATIGSISKATGNRGRLAAKGFSFDQEFPNNYELSYRNEGFRDNSTYSGTRNNSINTAVTEDTPIIHQTDMEESGSDYYGNASTLPLRTKGDDTISFLSNLKQTLPQYNSSQNQNGFTIQPIITSQSANDTLSYEKKIDNFNFTPIADSAENIFRKDNLTQFKEIRRPDSYYTAVRSSKAQPQKFSNSASSKPLPNENFVPTITIPEVVEPVKSASRPKTLYETSNEDQLHTNYHRSKSEALLETDFDDNDQGMVPTNKRLALSQPLETAM